MADGQRLWLASWLSCPALQPPSALPLTHLAVLLTLPARGRRRRGAAVTGADGGPKRITLSVRTPAN